MNCWVCEILLNWVGDEMVEDDDGTELIQTLLMCPKCSAEVTVLHGHDQD